MRKIRRMMMMLFKMIKLIFLTCSRRSLSAATVDDYHSDGDDDDHVDDDGDRSNFDNVKEKKFERSGSSRPAKNSSGE